MLSEVRPEAGHQKRGASGVATTATLLVSCHGAKGLVAQLSEIVDGHGCSILDADQHTDHHSGQLFWRICFELADARVDREGLESSIARLGRRWSMQHELRYGSAKKRIAIFVSRYDHCLYDLLLRQRARELDCQVSLVISNHHDLEPVARQFGVPFVALEVSPETKAAQERRAWELLDEQRVDLIVLARYMQILSHEFIARYPHRIINIHHSFLPAFVGSRPYHRAYERGVKLIGATAHYATSELDEGPIIEQDVVRASHRDSIEDLVRKGRDLERLALARAVKWHIEDRVLVHGNRTVVFG